MSPCSAARELQKRSHASRALRRTTKCRLGSRLTALLTVSCSFTMITRLPSLFALLSVSIAAAAADCTFLAYLACKHARVSSLTRDEGANAGASVNLICLMSAFSVTSPRQTLTSCSSPASLAFAGLCSSRSPTLFLALHISLFSGQPSLLGITSPAILLFVRSTCTSGWSHPVTTLTRFVSR